MKGSRLWTAIGSLAMLLAIVGLAIYSRTSVPKNATLAPTAAPIKVGAKAPPFSVTTLDGTKVDSSSLTAPTLLELFAPWCPHCQREVATLNDLAVAGAGKFNVLAVSAAPNWTDGTPLTLAEIQGFASGFNARYQIAFDPSLAVANAYLQGAYPTMVIINGDHRIVAIDVGETSRDKLVAQLHKAGASI
jgi:thiol-disulfide isomerase/thioredoxin